MIYKFNRRRALHSSPRRYQYIWWHIVYFVSDVTRRGFPQCHTASICVLAMLGNASFVENRSLDIDKEGKCLHYYMLCVHIIRFERGKEWVFIWSEAVKVTQLLALSDVWKRSWEFPQLYHLHRQLIWWLIVNILCCIIALMCNLRNAQITMARVVGELW